MISRRVVLLGVGATAGHLMLGHIVAKSQESQGVESQSPAGGDVRRLRVQMESTGHLELDPTGKKVTTTPFRVRADFDFVEKVVTQSTTTWVGRDFTQAQASIQVGRGSTTNKLTSSDEIIVQSIARIDDTQVKHQFSRASQPLDADEVDLVQIPGTSPLIDLWIADLKSKTIGEAWSPEGWTVAGVLAIDGVTDSKLKCQLKRRTSEKIEVTVQGTVNGIANSMPTEITLTGRLVVDAASLSVASLNWDIQEKRTIGPATPGFNARTKVEVVCDSPVSWGAEQQAQFEAVLSQGRDAGNQLTFHSDHHDFRISHAPHWKVIGDSPQAAILRYVDAGDLIAQAHMTRLEDLPVGGKLSLKKYREEVAKAIQESEGQIVDVTETTTARGYQALRVVVSAQVSSVPIQWIYYHITAANGQRVGWVITLEQDRIDRFGAEDQLLLEDFEILPSTRKSTPANAKTAERSSTVDK